MIETETEIVTGIVTETGTEIEIETGIVTAIVIETQAVGMTGTYSRVPVPTLVHFSDRHMTDLLARQVHALVQTSDLVIQTHTAHRHLTNDVPFKHKKNESEDQVPCHHLQPVDCEKHTSRSC